MKESNKWYSQKDDPLDESDIQGRIVFVENKDGGYEIYSPKVRSAEAIIAELPKYPRTIRYCLIDLPEEQPMELDGVKPEFYTLDKTESDFWHYQWINNDVEIHDRMQGGYTSKQSAIRAWNEFVKRMAK